jgi:hypothetical protein
MGASGLRGFHLHDYALDVPGWKDRAAFITAVFGNLSDKLDQAAAAIRAEFFVGDDREAWHAPILPEGDFWPVLDGCILSRDLEEMVERTGLPTLKNRMQRRQVYQHAVLMGWTKCVAFMQPGDDPMLLISFVHKLRSAHA